MRLNLAARAGRWSAAHWKTATFGWLAFVVIAVVLGGAIGTKTLGDGGSAGRVRPHGEDPRRGLRAAGRGERARAEPHPHREEPGLRGAVEDVLARVSAGPAVLNLRDPLGPANAEQISPDGRSALVTFDIRGPPEDAVDKIDPVLAAVDQAKAAHPDLFIGSFGEASAEKEITDAVGKDLGQAGLLSLPGHDRRPDRRLRRARRRWDPAPARA